MDHGVDSIQTSALGVFVVSSLLLLLYPFYAVIMNENVLCKGMWFAVVRRGAAVEVNVGHEGFLVNYDGIVFCTARGLPTS
jgi:hypothetical protein